MKIKLPPHMLFDHDLRLMVWRPRGILDEKAVNRLIKFIGDEEATSNKPFNRFSDTLSAEVVELNFNYIFHVCLFRRLSYAGRPPVKSAILISSLARAHYSKLVEIMMQGSPLKVRLFEDRAEAAKWLGFSVETLEY
jgi:hypothetical protein